MKNYQNPASEHTYRALLADLSAFPVCFTYGGKDYSGFGDSDMAHLETAVTTDDQKETTDNIFLLADTLKITLKTAFYPSHGAYEWTLWFENVTADNSAVLENVRTVYHFTGDHPVLRGIYGDLVNLYRPYVFDIAQEKVHFESNSGRATHVNFPYFNLEYGNGGAMLAIGWAGTWPAEFERTADGVCYVARSVNNLRTYLKPQEKIRTALFAVAPYAVRDEQYATNFWRDWYVQCNMPKADGEGNPLEPFSTWCMANDTGLTNSDGSISEQHDTWRPSLEGMLAQDAKVDFRWFDAGWYQTPYLGSAKSFVKGEDWWDTVGTWVLDPEKWPGDSFLQSTEFARQNGMKTLMWFEPERVTYPDDMVKNFGYKRDWAIEQDGVAVISNNIGDNECRRWTTDRICKTLRENKVEMYREDNNCDAAQLWAFLDARDGDDRLGITECKFINAHYQMWDDIIDCTKSYGGCAFVDSCASGGGRNDLESMRRGVPLLRSDSDRTSSSLRLSMTSSFNKWIPFCGASTREQKEQHSLTGISDEYVWRASYLPSLNVVAQFVYPTEEMKDYDMLRFGLRECKRVAPYMLKEFYALTPWHCEQETNGFTAYAYYDPDSQTGCLLAFRQETCEESDLTVTLPFAGGNCRLIDEDSDESYPVTDGQVTLHFADARTARLLWIEN